MATRFSLWMITESSRKYQVGRSRGRCPGRQKWWWFHHSMPMTEFWRINFIKLINVHLLMIAHEARLDLWSVEYQQDVEKMIPIKSRSKPHRAPAPLKIFLLKMNVIFRVSDKFWEISAEYWLLLYIVILYMKGWFNTPSNDGLNPHIIHRSNPHGWNATFDTTTSCNSFLAQSLIFWRVKPPICWLFPKIPRTIVKYIRKCLTWWVW